jgi:hypothetical protein
MPPPMPMAAPMSVAELTDTASGAEGATQIAFTLPRPVDIPSGNSALVPIIDRDIPIERLDLFQHRSSRANPLASLRLRNDGKTGLPPGIVTLYETAAGNAYIGDARIAAVPVGEERLVSYAVDEKTRVITEFHTDTKVTKVAIADGALRLSRLSRTTDLYRIAAPASEPRTVTVEQDKVAGAKLVEPTAVTETPSSYRATIALKPGETRNLTFTFDKTNEETVQIGSLDDKRIATMSARGELDAAAQRAFAELARLKRAASEANAAVAAIAAKLTAIGGDQERLRANLTSVDRDSDLHKRYIKKLDEEETQIESLSKDKEAATRDAKTADDAVGHYIAQLRL